MSVQRKQDQHKGSMARKGSSKARAQLHRCAPRLPAELALPSLQAMKITEAVSKIRDIIQYSLCKSTASVLFFNLWKTNSNTLSPTRSVLN